MGDLLVGPHMRGDWDFDDLMSQREVDASLAVDGDPDAVPGGYSRGAEGPCEDPQYFPRRMTRVIFGSESPKLPGRLIPVADSLDAYSLAGATGGGALRDSYGG